MYESCMVRHGFDVKLMDYTWKQNRLSKDKEALKNSVLNVIRKKPKAEDETGRTGKNVDQGLTKKAIEGSSPEYAGGQ